MSASLILAAIWAIASSCVALLPVRMQYGPSLGLLIVAPGIIGFMGYQFGLWVAVAGLLAVVSVFRTPLTYFWRRFHGARRETSQ